MLLPPVSRLLRITGQTDREGKNGSRSVHPTPTDPPTNSPGHLNTGVAVDLTVRFRDDRNPSPRKPVTKDPDPRIPDLYLFADCPRLPSTTVACLGGRKLLTALRGSHVYRSYAAGHGSAGWHDHGHAAGKRLPPILACRPAWDKYGNPAEVCSLVTGKRRILG